MTNEKGLKKIVLKIDGGFALSIFNGFNCNTNMPYGIFFQNNFKSIFRWVGGTK